MKHDMRRLLVFSILCAALATAACVPQTSTFETSELLLSGANGEVRVTARIADTPALQERGLMGVTHLDANEGMLFVFGNEETRYFWMKDTPLPLTIAFLDANKTIVDVQDMQPYNETIIASAAPAQYALEMNQGFFTQHAVRVGDTMRFS
jgi:uncharacterized membrane protein (UPF0127 family)